MRLQELGLELVQELAQVLILVPEQELVEV